MLRFKDIINVLNFEQALCAPVEVSSPTLDEQKCVLDMFNWEQYEDEVTGEILYRRKV